MRFFRRARIGLGVIAAFVAVAVFIVGVYFVLSAVKTNVARQAALRTAAIDRARVLILQLNEETGIRGYSLTHSQVFLQPFALAHPVFRRYLNEFRGAMWKLGLPADMVNEEQALNTRWLHEYAEPILRNPKLADSTAFQLHGKTIIDELRSRNALLFYMLERTAQSSEITTAALIARILIASIVAGTLIAGFFVWLAAMQKRTSDELESERRARLQEQRVAEMLQEAFLQRTLPSMENVKLNGVYVPAGREALVGGDFYGARNIRNRLLFKIGDVAGHGVDAAVAMSLARQAMLAISVDDEDPAQMLMRTNEVLLIQDIATVTAICGTYDPRRGTIAIANAGHPPALLVGHDGSIQTVGASGPPLGAIDNPIYTTQTFNAADCAMLALYTDGLIENERNLITGEARLRDIVQTLSPDVDDPAAAMLQSVFHGDAPLDDVAILTLRFTHKPAPTPRSLIVA